jgi:outer membrane biosynthesis protein TonB
MTSRARLLATVLLLSPVAFACGKKEEQPPVRTQAASPTLGVAATEAAAVAPSPAATTTTPPAPAGTAAPAVSAAAPPPAMAAPKAPVTTQATQPQAPPPPAAATSAPPPTTQAEKPAAPQRPKDKITLPAKLGAVTFDHENHTGKRGIACTSCHHPSRPQKPLASENQACRDCHTMPAAPPLKTSLQAAFHDPKGATGTCIDCHKQRGGAAPVKCLECHKKK